MATSEDRLKNVTDWEREHGFHPEDVFNALRYQPSELGVWFPGLDRATLREGADRWADYAEQCRAERRTRAVSRLERNEGFLEDLSRAARGD